MEQSAPLPRSSGLPRRAPAWAGRLLRNEAIQGALALWLLLAVFFSTPLVNLNTHHFSAADIGQLFPLTHTGPTGYVVKNGLLSDTVVDFQPWLFYSRDRIHAGELPLWNPYNANGVPLIANFQSAVFSLFSLPFYVLPFKIALLLSAFLKLFGIGWFTFLFLKLLGLRQIPALVGATAFMFSGYNVVWLGYPLSSAVITLPTLMYFAERLLSSVTPKPGVTYRPLRAVWSLVGFALSLAVGLLAGHPETFYACFLLVVAYIAFRLVNLWQMAGWGWAGLRRSVVFGVALSLAGVVGAGLASVQLFPFFEYWTQSDASHNAQAWTTSAPVDLLPLNVFPDVLGNPSESMMQPLLGVISNYNESNGSYLGMFALGMAVIGTPLLVLGSRRYRRYALFFGAVGVVWCIYAMNLFNLKETFNLIPGVTVLHFNRTYMLWTFIISTGAALFVDALFDMPARGVRLRAYVLVLAGLALAGLAAWRITTLLSYYYPLAVSHFQVAFEPLSRHHDLMMRHIYLMIGAYTVGLMAMIRLALSRGRTGKTVSGIVVLLVVFYQAGFWLKDYNPTIIDELFFPETQDTYALRETINAQNVGGVGWAVVAGMNVAYQIPMVSNYDVIGVRNYTRLLGANFRYQPGPQVLSGFTEAALRLFSVDTLVVHIYPAYEAQGQLPPEKFERVSVNEALLYAIYRYRDAVPLYHVVYDATIATTEEAAFEAVMLPDFDPGASVVLTVPNGAAPLDVTDSEAASSAVEVLSEEPEAIRLRAVLDQPGYLVLAKTYYPGWRVSVNGIDQPLYQANYAFSAVALPPGNNVVEYVYEPESMRYGLLVSGAALLVVLMTAGAALVWQRRSKKETTALAHPLVTQLRFARMEFKRALEGVGEEDALRRIEPMNCLSWMVGHLACQEQLYWLTRAQDITPVPAVNAMGFGQPASTPPLDEMWQAWETITEASNDWLDSLTSAQMATHMLNKDNQPYKESIGTMMRRATYHYWYHIGESQAIRQMLGHESLPVFVGNLHDLAPYVSESD